MLGTPAGTKVNICRHLVKPTEVWTDRTQKKKTPLVLIHLPIVQLSDTGEWPNPTFPASFYASGKKQAGAGSRWRAVQRADGKHKCAFVPKSLPHWPKQPG